MMVTSGHACRRPISTHSEPFYCKSSDCTGYLFMEPFLFPFFSFFPLFFPHHVHDNAELATVTDRKSSQVLYLSLEQQLARTDQWGQYCGVV